MLFYIKDIYELKQIFVLYVVYMLCIHSITYVEINTDWREFEL